jgi:RND family efflux transporter MFP subunit
VSRLLRAALLAPLALILASACDDAATADGGWGGGNRGPTPVVAVPVRFETERARIEAVGTARAVRSVELYPEAAGEVVEVAFQPGDRVTRGQVLLALDARDERLAVQLAEVRVEEARQLFERYTNANVRGERTVPATQVDAARSALEATRIELDRARVALDRRDVIAPFDGVVGLTDVDVGDRIDPTTPITSLDDRSELLVRFDVPESYIGRVEAEDPISVETWTAGRVRASGTVFDVDSRIDPATRAFGVRAKVPNPDDVLRPGMSFRILLDLEGATWPSVPEVAVLWGADGAYVWIVEDGQVTRREAGIVQRGKGRVLVDADLSPGMMVVGEGVQRMRAGLAVRVLDPEALARDTRAVLSGDADPRSPAR